MPPQEGNTRSRHVDRFDHDPQADWYDDNVLDESDPIRAGYDAALAWVVEHADAGPDDVVIDLGSGTGNTSARLPVVGRLICVDVSRKMTDRARPKLAHQPVVEFVQADFLEYFHGPVPAFDALVSTYAVHHLTDDEKRVLFARIFEHLAPGGRAAFGDLMFESRTAKARIAKAYADAGDTGMVEEFDDEFFWLVDEATHDLEALGFEVVAVRRFSQLSWGICVRKPTTGHANKER